jgi:hypothetical protein
MIDDDSKLVAQKFRFKLATKSELTGCWEDALFAEIDGWRCFFETLKSEAKKPGVCMWKWTIQTGGGWGGYRDTTPEVVTHASGRDISLELAMMQCWGWLQENGTYTRL